MGNSEGADAKRGKPTGFASRTTTPVEKTQTEIRTLVKKRGATSFGLIEDKDQAIVAFEMSGRRIRFYLPIPHDATDQHVRQKWRALLLAIKAKLESVESGIETFDEAFLAHVVLPDGSIFSQYAATALKEVAQGRPLPPLLEGPK